MITHSEVGTGQKINPKIGTGSITGLRGRERERERSWQFFTTLIKLYSLQANITTRIFIFYIVFFIFLIILLESVLHFWVFPYPCGSNLVKWISGKRNKLIDWLTGTVRGRSKNDESKNSFCHLLANVSTTTLDRFRLLSLHVRTAIYKLIRYYDRYRFHLLSRRVCNLQLRNMFVAVGRQKECVTGAKYYSYVWNFTLCHMKV